MVRILIHGLGQNERSWKAVHDALAADGIDTTTVNLFDFTENDKRYSALYHAFCDYCMKQKGKVNLCGLSLGGVLALDFVKEHPEKVNSLILIGTPYQIPKALYKLQGLLFHIMPKSTFNKMGCKKSDIITLVNSMSNLILNDRLERITCDCLILCGENDKINKKSAVSFHKQLKNSRMQIIMNAGHEVNVDDPMQLAAAVKAFWQDK